MVTKAAAGSGPGTGKSVPGGLPLGRFYGWVFVGSMVKCSTVRDFLAGQGDLTPPYSVYGKENQRRAAEKGPLPWRFALFQTRPNHSLKPEATEEADMKRTLSIILMPAGTVEIIIAVRM